MVKNKLPDEGRVSKKGIADPTNFPRQTVPKMRGMKKIAIFILSLFLLCFVGGTIILCVIK